MRIAIVNNAAPFTFGGAEFLAENLKKELSRRGHPAIVVRLPFQWQPCQSIPEQILACRFLHLGDDFIDRVIALKFPAYFVPHRDKVLWLLHQFRQAYDLWGTPYQGIPDTPEGLAIRAAIVQADNTYLAEAKRIFTNNGVVSRRLKRFNGLDSEVLYPPLMDAELYHCSGYGDFLFYPSRINDGKRQLLAIEALRHCRSAVKLVIAGRPDDAAALARCQERLRQCNVGDRVEIRSTFIAQTEKADLLARCLGAVYIPYDEDSYGYVSLEAYHARKPVITCADSGGTLDVVRDGETGLVVAAEPEALAAAMDQLYEDRAAAQRMGQAGFDLIQTLEISWDRVVARLTA
jgi:glycosyltransferase involved in cell wall biosynthesis